MEKISCDDFFYGEFFGPVFEIVKEIDENISAPLSIGCDESEEYEVDVVGCTLKFTKHSFNEAAIAYLGVRPISDDIPKRQFAISPEVECEIFNPTCERQVTIFLPLSKDKKLLEERNPCVLGKVDGTSKWTDLSGNCKDLQKTLKDQYVKLQVSIHKSIKVLVTCSEIHANFTRHFLYAKHQNLCRVVCLNNEALVTRMNDIFNRESFQKSEVEVPPVPESAIGERLVYPNIQKSSTVSSHSGRAITLEGQEVIKIFCNPMWQTQKQDTEKLETLETLRLRQLKFSCPAPYSNVRRSTKRFYIENSANKENYRVNLEKGCKGIALIINNEIKGLDKREGWYKDMKMQIALWKDLGFNVIPKINLTAEDMANACCELASLATERQASIVVTVVMTHGAVLNKGQAFQGEDGNLIYLDDIVSPFIKKGVLEGIPKVFMLEACRVELRGEDQSIANALKTIYRHIFDRSSNDADVGNTVGDSARPRDMLFVYPCLIDKGATRNTYSGSYLMMTIPKVFMKHAHNKHVLDMLTMVNDDISKLGGENIQTSCQNSLMRKNLFLFPGWPTKL